MKKLICNEVARCQPAIIREKLFHTSSFIFSECITIISFEESLKVCEHNFFQRKVVLIFIYLFNHDSSKPTIFMSNMKLELSWVQFLSNKLESFLFCNIKLVALCFGMTYRKSGSRDLERLQMRPWDPRPRPPKCLGGTQDLGPWTPKY